MRKPIIIVLLLGLILLLTSCTRQGREDTRTDMTETSPSLSPQSREASTPALTIATASLSTPQTKPWRANSAEERREWLSETRKVGGASIWVNMPMPIPFPDETPVLRAKFARPNTAFSRDSVISALQLTAIPAGFSLDAWNGTFQFGPLDPQEYDISPLPTGDYPADVSLASSAVYRLHEFSQPVGWSANPDSVDDGIAAIRAAQGFAKRLALPIAAPSVLYSTPLLDGRTATALFFPYLLHGLPLQSEHTVHDNWKDSDGREWGYANRQGMRITVLDDGRVYQANASRMVEKTGVQDPQPRLISWEDALTSLMASVNLRTYSPGASGNALVAVRACYVLSAVPGSYEEFEAIPAYELCFRFYNGEQSSLLETFVSSWTFALDARTGKVFRQ